MSLKVGYVIFYIAFLAILAFISVEMGVQVLSIGQEQLIAIPQSPQPETGLLGSLTFVFQMVVFGLVTFFFLVTVSTEFLFLTIFVVLPLTVGFLWALLELARGSG